MTTSAQPKLKISTAFPAVLYVDGAKIGVRVKRMNNTEFDAFELGYDCWGRPPAGPEPETVAQRIAREQASEEWLRTSLRDYLTINDGDLVVDDRSVVSGEELVDLFAGRNDVIPQALTVIYMENRLSEDQKKVYRSALDSFTTSQAVRLTADSGSAPAPTAASAEPSASASGEAATASAAAPSCGPTDPCDSAPVPSEK